jgi:hypothetical protein
LCEEGTATVKNGACRSVESSCGWRHFGGYDRIDAQSDRVEMNLEVFLVRAATVEEETSMNRGQIASRYSTRIVDEQRRDCWLLISALATLCLCADGVVGINEPIQTVDFYAQSLTTLEVQLRARNVKK